jgi:hypothetical protein
VRRNKRDTIDTVCQLRGQGKTIRAIAASVGLAKSYVHRIVQQVCPLLVLAHEDEIDKMAGDRCGIARPEET